MFSESEKTDLALVATGFVKEDVGPFKNVNGVDVLMSDKERVDTAALWSKNAQRPVAVMQVPDVVSEIAGDPVKLAALKAALGLI
jgi:hypothetical protein